MTTPSERAMTWAALLGKWTEFAQSALALPDDDEGGRLREAVPAIIGLQAVTHVTMQATPTPIKTSSARKVSTAR